MIFFANSNWCVRVSLLLICHFSMVMVSPSHNLVQISEMSSLLKHQVTGFKICVWTFIISFKTIFVQRMWFVSFSSHYWWTSNQLKLPAEPKHGTLLLSQKAACCTFIHVWKWHSNYIMQRCIDNRDKTIDYEQSL